MLNSLFKSEDEIRNITRKAKLKILKAEIVYNDEDDVYETMATCINEDNKIETISIEDFTIDSVITNFVGTYIDYEEYTKDGEESFTGRIYRG